MEVHVLFGYARVSTVDQDTALQVLALRSAGVARVFQESASGVCSRPELERLLYCLRRGDVLCVYKVDRVARSLADLLRVIDRVSSVGASFRSVTEPIDTSTPVGVMLLQLLGAFAQFERSVIRERCAAGRAAALARGVVLGRPRKIDLDALPALVSAGLSAREIAARFGCDRSSVAHAARSIGLHTCGRPGRPSVPV
jgi:DNA invertase Pin-like site-specific DNA recombinase